MINNSRLQSLLRYWDAKRGDNPMASRQQIDPLEIPSLLSIVLLADVTADGTRLRLLGTEATAAYGQETRGKWADEFDLGEFSAIWLDAVKRVVASGEPAFGQGRFQKDTRFFDAEIVLMPLSDNGVSVSHIFGGLHIRPTSLNNMINERRSLPAKHQIAHVKPLRTDIDALTG